MPDVDEALDNHKSIVRGVVEADLQNSLADNAEVANQLDQLRKVGLVEILAPTTSVTDLKFYVILQEPASSRVVLEDAEGTINSYLNSGQHSMRAVSLYPGSGFGAFMLKGVVNNYQELAEQAEGIANVAAKAGLRPMTLILVNTGGESDSVTNVGEVLSSEAGELLDRIFQVLALSDLDREDLRRQFLLMKRLQREAYVEVHHNYWTLFEPEFSEAERFYRIIVAIAVNDVDGFGEKLAFLQKLESLLRRYLRRVWIERFGEDWLSRVTTILRDTRSATYKTELAQRGYGSWSLRDLATISGAVDLEDGGLAHSIEDELGSGWQATVTGVSQLRNDVAHGRVFEYESLSEFRPLLGGTRESSLLPLLKGGVLYKKLLELVK